MRVARTCRELGVATAAVYSEADRDALHVRIADEAFSLGTGGPAETYLSIGAIVEVLRYSGADAVHPGYGFLAENAAFARAVADAGAIFVGPPPSAIETMGSKLTAREAAARVGRGGRAGPQRAGQLRGRGPRLRRRGRLPGGDQGFLRGGGRGMKVVAEAADVTEARSVPPGGRPRPSSAAATSTSSATSRPRHVEMQVFADRLGDVVWLGERDCSSQRRHQKLVEESPAPGIADDGARRDGRRGGAVVARLRLRGGGHRRVPLRRWRLLLPRDEHPPASRASRSPSSSPASTSSRCNCASPRANRSASPRTRSSAAATRSNVASTPKTRPADASSRVRDGSPASVSPDGFGVRTDTGYEQGDVVGSEFDNLVAKLVVWGTDREDARRRMIRARSMRRSSRASRRRFRHVALILCHEDFVAARHSTRFVEDRLDFSALAPTLFAERHRRRRRPRAPYGRRRGRRPPLLGAAVRFPRRREHHVPRPRGGVTPEGRPLLRTGRSPSRCRGRSCRCSSRRATGSLPGTSCAFSRR